jgi:hypothetical protein
LDRVVGSGIFSNKPVASKVAAAAAPAPAAGPFVATTVGAQLVEWDYRNGQLKLTLELANAELTMLDITRRLERVPGLGPLRIGQDGGGNLLTLSAAVNVMAAEPDQVAGR